MATKTPNFKKASYAEVFEWLKTEDADNNGITIRGFLFKRASSDAGITIDVTGLDESRFYWFGSQTLRDKKNISLFGNPGFHQLQAVVDSAAKLATMLGYDELFGMNQPGKSQGEIDGYTEEDLEHNKTVAKLEGQIEVYKSIVPTMPTGEVTFRS